MQDKVTILVNSCDNYSDLWDIFFKLLKKYWPECKCRIILNTESKNYTYNGFEIECFDFYKRGQKVPYGERILRHLKEITTEYTLMLMDDFFLRDFVDIEKIIRCLAWMDENKKIVAFHFTPLPDENNIISSQYEGFEKRSDYAEFKLCFLPALWRTKKLISYWRPHENPWHWEMIGNIRTFNNKEDEFYNVCKNEPLIINYGNSYDRCWGIVQGKWVKSNVDAFFTEHEIKVDYSQRGIFTEADRLRFVKQSYLKKWTDEYKSLKGTGMVLKFWTWKVRRLIQTIKKENAETLISYFARKIV